MRPAYILGISIKRSGFRLFQALFFYSWLSIKSEYLRQTAAAVSTEAPPICCSNRMFTRGSESQLCAMKQDLRLSKVMSTLLVYITTKTGQLEWASRLTTLTVPLAAANLLFISIMCLSHIICTAELFF